VKQIKKQKFIGQISTQPEKFEEVKHSKTKHQGAKEAYFAGWTHARKMTKIKM